MRLIEVAKLKFPDRLVARGQVTVVADDDFGVWVAFTHEMWGPNDASWTAPYLGIQLLPRQQAWWLASWWDKPAAPWARADVVVPTRYLGGDVFEWVDLEIDVVGDHHG